MKKLSHMVNIDMEGNLLTIFKNKSGNILAKGYERVVVGDRGAYIEFIRSSICEDKLYVPPCEEHRIGSPRVYYDEYRSHDVAYTKVYHQKRTVKYADYLVDRYYISPFDLYVDGRPCAENFPKFSDLIKIFGGDDATIT